MEQTSPAARTLWPTLTSCYRPIESYLEQLAATSAGAPEPALTLSALDAFLLRQLAAALPSAPTVIDLAADALGGTSVAGWLASGSVRWLSVPAARGGGAWRKPLPHIAELLGWDLSNCDLAAQLPAEPLTELTAGTSAPWTQWAAGANPLAPVLVLLPAHWPNLADWLARLHAWQPQAVVAFIGWSKTAASADLPAALNYCAAQPAYTLTPLREVSPFFFNSSLVWLHARDHAAVQTLSERLRQTYEGNFQFLTLVQALTQQSLQKATPAATPVAQPFTPSLEPPTFAVLRYETKRWLWQRVLPPWFKRSLNRVRQRPQL